MGCSAIVSRCEYFTLLSSVDHSCADVRPVFAGGGAPRGIKQANTRAHTYLSTHIYIYLCVKTCTHEVTDVYVCVYKRARMKDCMDTTNIIQNTCTQGWTCMHAHICICACYIYSHIHLLQPIEFSS